MKMILPVGRRCAAFTLAEVLIASAISVIMIAGLLLGTTALQRSFSAVDAYSSSENDEMRVLGYIGRDVRNAKTISTTGSTLTLTIPNYYANAAPSTTPNVPSVTSGSPVYGGGTNTITYTLSNSNQITRSDGGKVLIVASKVASFSPVIDTSYDPSGRTLSTSITFAPSFNTLGLSGATSGTTLSGRASMRN